MTPLHISSSAWSRSFSARNFVSCLNITWLSTGCPLDFSTSHEPMPVSPRSTDKTSWSTNPRSLVRLCCQQLESRTHLSWRESFFGTSKAKGSYSCLYTALAKFSYPLTSSGGREDSDGRDGGCPRLLPFHVIPSCTIFSFIRLTAGTAQGGVLVPAYQEKQGSGEHQCMRSCWTWRLLLSWSRRWIT